MNIQSQRLVQFLPHLPPYSRWLPVRSFERVQAMLAFVGEVFAESQDMAREAHRRWPFAEW